MPKKKGNIFQTGAKLGAKLKANAQPTGPEPRSPVTMRAIDDGAEGTATVSGLRFGQEYDYDETDGADDTATVSLRFGKPRPKKKDGSIDYDKPRPRVERITVPAAVARGLTVGDRVKLTITKV